MDVPTPRRVHASVGEHVEVDIIVVLRHHLPHLRLQSRVVGVDACTCPQTTETLCGVSIAQGQANSDKQRGEECHNLRPRLQCGAGTWLGAVDSLSSNSKSV